MNEYESSNKLKFSCKYHVIFCPKYRKKILGGHVGEYFKFLVKNKMEEYRYDIIEMEVMPDHVHLLLSVSPKDNINLIVGKIKGYSSRELKLRFSELSWRKHIWSPSRFISSVGAVSLNVVKNYIINQ